MTRKIGLSVALAVVAGLIATAALYAAGIIGSSDPSYNGTIVEASGEPAEFNLVSAENPDVKLSDYRDQLVVMYFGYTHCPDFCPATLSKLAQVKDQLGEDAEDVQVMMITVDPERDSAQILADYVANFDETFLGLTGSDEQIAAAASKFGIYYQKQEGSEASGYLVDHTITVVVVDREGYPRLYLGNELTADEIANDLKNLL